MGRYQAGKTECRRCLKFVDTPVNEAQKARGVCDSCWADDVKREQERNNAVCGGLSSPEADELRAQNYPSIPYHKIIGMRSDARWYKKPGVDS